MTDDKAQSNVFESERDKRFFGYGWNACLDAVREDLSKKHQFGKDVKMIHTDDIEVTLRALKK